MTSDHWAFEHRIFMRLNMKKRPKLFKWFEWHNVEGLKILHIGGDLRASKQKDTGALSFMVLQPPSSSSSWTAYFLTDIAIGSAESNGREIFTVAKIRVDDFIDTLKNCGAIKIRKESTGRPQKYGLQTLKDVHRLHNDGKSIRAIAVELGISTSTVQKLLKL